MRLRTATALVMVAVLAGISALAVPGCPKGKTNTPEAEGDPPDTGPDPNQKPITPEQLREVNQVFRAGKSDIERCFQAMVTRKKNPKLKGRVIIGVTIGLRATPQKVWVYKMCNMLRDAQFEACVREEVMKWEFPVLGSKYDLTSPRYFLEVY